MVKMPTIAVIPVRINIINSQFATFNYYVLEINISENCYKNIVTFYCITKK